MGQLNNLYVSQSYQGLLKLTNSTSGLTNTLSTIQTGDGTNSPLQLSTTNVNVVGNLTNQGTFYPDIIDVSLGSIQQGTGSYVATINNSGIVEYATYSEVLTALNITGSSGTSGTSGTDGSSGTSGTSGTDGSSGTSGDSLFAQTGSWWNTTNNIGVTGSVNLLSGDKYFNLDPAGIRMGGPNENADVIITGSILMNRGALEFDNQGDSNIKFLQKTGSSVYQVGVTVDNRWSVMDQPSNKKIVLMDTSSFRVPVSSSVFDGETSFTTGIINGLKITGNTIITGALIVSSSAVNDLVITGSVAITRPVGSTATTQLVVTSSVGRTTISPSNFEALNSNTQNVVYGNSLGFGMYNNNTSDELGFTIDPTNFGISGGTGNTIYVNDPTDSYPAMINFQNKANWTDGRISLQKNTDITGSLRVTNIPTGSSTNYVVWNSSSKQLEYTTGSGGSGSSGTSGSSGSSGTSGTSGDSIFAQTGSWWNTTRNVGISGSLRLSGSATYDLEVTGSARFVNPTNTQINTITPTTFNINTTNAAGVNAENYVFGSTGSISSLYVGVYDQPNFNQDVEFKLSVQTGSGISFNDWDNVSVGDYIPWLTIAPNLGNNPAPQFKRSVGITGSLVASGSLHRLIGTTTLSGSLNIQSGSNFPQATGSALLAWNSSTGQVTHTTYASALPALFDVGYFYSTQTQSGSANVSGSFTFDNTVPINAVTVSGSRINIPKTAWYNFQFSIQAVQGAGAGDVAVWLKKDGVNVANTATYVTVPSNQKSLIALNLWEQVNSGSYVELAHQSDSNNTTFQYIAPTGNIPDSPSIIMNVNQIR